MRSPLEALPPQAWLSSGSVSLNDHSLVTLHIDQTCNTTGEQVITYIEALGSNPADREYTNIATKTSCSSTPCSSSLVSWNIAGLADKVCDPTWLTFIKQHAVICLQETWLVEKNVFIEGYQSFFTPADPSRSGRAKGAWQFMSTWHSHVK